MSDQQPLPVRF
jgi:hypothetical protein